MNADKKTGRRRLEREESSRYARLLMLIGAGVCLFIGLESYFQLSGSAFSFLALAHENGWLTGYAVAREPNKGIWHPVGWGGSACFVLMMLYSLRKRARFMRNAGSLRTWLDTHVFLGLLGAALVTYHTTGKIGGLVAVSYWSMALVTISGVFGRYVYVRIPRSISGQELRIGEIEQALERVSQALDRSAQAPETARRYADSMPQPRPPEGGGLVLSLFSLLAWDVSMAARLFRIRRALAADPDLPSAAAGRLFALLRAKIRLTRSIAYLGVTQRMLHHWHVFHKPLAALMFIIMALHVAVFYFFRVAVN